MPFEISPEFKPTIEPIRVGRFQDIADAMFRGCLISKQCRDGNFVVRRPDGLYSCALGAMRVGNNDEYPEEFDEVCNAYRIAYNSSIMMDNDTGTFTREQIAARIAAL